MAFLFQRGKKTPQQLVQAVHSELTSGSAGKKESKLHKRFTQMKLILYGEPNKPPKLESCEELSRSIQSVKLDELCMERMARIDFETRQLITLVIESLIRNDYAKFATKYLAEKPSLIHSFALKYDEPEIAQHFGAIIRACISKESLCCILLYDNTSEGQIISTPVQRLFTKYVHSSNFEIAADALSTLKALLTAHRNLALEFMAKTKSHFFRLYNDMIQSENYVTRRQALKLLGELLLDRNNFDIMIDYINNKTHLKLVLLMLRDPRANIQYEAFHVFKIFVANPRKSSEIVKILSANKSKLVDLLRDFHPDKDDEQFVEEKALLIQTISRLPDPQLQGKPSGSEEDAAQLSSDAAAGADDATNAGSAPSGS